MNVLIIETKTGKVIANIPVTLQTLNYAPSEQEYFSAAWESAVEDGAVDQKDKKSYTFQLAPHAQPG